MNSETQPYKAQMLQQLIKNVEKIAVIAKEVSDIKTELKEVKATTERAEWWLKFIAGAVVLSCFKEQLMSFF